MKNFILYEDKNIIIVNKPAGLIVHPLKRLEEKSLVRIILKHYPLIKEVGENPLRPGIVHRLDKDTSGLIVIAKNNLTYQWLKEQFCQRKVKKIYLALVIGRVKNNKGIVIRRIGRSKRSNKQSIFQKSLFKAKEAITKYEVIKRFRNYTLLKVIPKTGRTHQIRVHLAAIGHPIAGDQKYKFKRQSSLLGLKRLFLHASQLEFRMFDGQKMSFKTALPEDLEKVLQSIEN